MTLINPSALFLCLLGLPILLLYMLKLRRRRVQVSTILLWQMLLKDRQANTPWQKLRRNLLLFLQLLTLIFLVLALSQPALPVASVTSGSLVVLLDASASMNTAEISEIRFETARTVVHELIQGLGITDHMSLILVKAQPVILAAGESDKNRLFEALTLAEPTNGAVNWEAAFALAAGAASQAGSDPTIAIISDGGLPEAGLPSLPGDIRYLPIGETDDNLAISAFALRQSGETVELFTKVNNYGSTDQDVLLSIYINEELLEAHKITISAADQESLTIQGLYNTPGVYFARLAPTEDSASTTSADPFVDALELDNSAYAIYKPPKTGRVLLATPGNIFLEQVLASLPYLTTYQLKLDEDSRMELPEDSFDCYVFDGVLPEILPAGNLILINPPNNDLFEVRDSFLPNEMPTIHPHPFTNHLDWSNVHIAQARDVQTPSWAEILIEEAGKPIVFIGETDGRRLAVLTFDIHQSDLPLQVAFPVLMANLLDYVVPINSFEWIDGILPGDTIHIHTQPVVNEVRIDTPSGKTHLFPASTNGILFSETQELGLYAVHYIKDNSHDVEHFAVNLFDPQESNIQPRSSVSIGSSSIQASSADRLSLHELWPWTAAAALLILLLEWWVYHRYTQIS